jgi:hypothetical protein
MAKGKHYCTKSKRSTTYDPKWSGVSYAPHADLWHKKCGEQVHKEADTLYCPRCDEQVSEKDCEVH